ncbi:MAG TPA: nitronate monooxygenase [Pseudonocardia sp.]|jgi:enoyl-[acyl-carrier protein] reductase II|nr:nitronate monooxygenase [Pseudonocardia sp.]
MADISVPTRLTSEYGLRHPFVSAGMGFVAHERLAAAVSNAGGLGILGASPDPPASLAAMTERMRLLTDRPWGVDLIRAETGFGPASRAEHVEVCLAEGVPLVVFHHDPPPADWVRRLARGGARVWMQVSSVELAATALELGVHGLVAQGREAGGHTRSTVALAELLGRLRASYPDTLLLAAGGSATGRRWRRRCEGGPTACGWAPGWSPPRRPMPTRSTRTGWSAPAAPP